MAGRQQHTGLAIKRFIALLLAAFALLPFALLPSLATAQQETALQEAAIKAAYLVRFADYVAWPPGAASGADTALVIGVLATDRAQLVAEELERMASSRRAGERPIEVRQLKSLDSLAGLHILYAGASATDSLARVARQPVPTLFVGDTAKAMDAGCVIGFVIENGRVRFEVSQEAARRHSLTISSRLLSVATRVW